MSPLATQIVFIVLAAGFAVGMLDIAYDNRGSAAARLAFGVGTILAAITLTSVAFLVINGPA